MNKKLPAAAVILLLALVIGSLFVNPPASEGGLVITGLAVGDDPAGVDDPGLVSGAGQDVRLVIEGEVYTFEPPNIIDPRGTDIMYEFVSGNPPTTEYTLTIENTSGRETSYGRMKAYYARAITVQENRTLAVGDFVTSREEQISVPAGQTVQWSHTAALPVQVGPYPTVALWFELTPEGKPEQESFVIISAAKDLDELLETGAPTVSTEQTLDQQIVTYFVQMNFSNPFMALASMLDEFFRTGDVSLPTGSGEGYGGDVSLPTGSGESYGGDV